MASFHLLHNLNPQLDSPAKVFAKLKSKVQKEAIYSKGGHNVDVTEKRGTDFASPGTKGTDIWTNETFKENENEAEALSLSPMSSPEKPFEYSCSTISSKLLEETTPVIETERGCTRRVRAFLQSTAVSHSHSLVNRDVIKNRTSQIGDSGGFMVHSRTPVKPVENTADNCAHIYSRLSPAGVFSPSRKGLMKRKWEQREFNEASGITLENDENISPPKERKTFTIIEDDIRNKNMQDSARIRGCPGDQSEIHHEPMFPPSKVPLGKCE